VADLACSSICPAFVICRLEELLERKNLQELKTFVLSIVMCQVDS
jgi:hypothetical protein